MCTVLLPPGDNPIAKFDVLLPVHLAMFLVNHQLDAPLLIDLFILKNRINKSIKSGASSWLFTRNPIAVNKYIISYAVNLLVVSSLVITHKLCSLHGTN
jgi:hypothetical protein